MDEEDAAWRFDEDNEDSDSLPTIKEEELPEEDYDQEMDEEEDVKMGDESNPEEAGTQWAKGEVNNMKTEKKLRPIQMGE